jgi:ssDNA-binding Zn-finger/Zn-ribbon topoisomerase 1
MSMVYVTNCPKCHETISFLNNEDTKVCKKCGEVVFNTNAHRQTTTITSKNVRKIKRN